MEAFACLPSVSVRLVASLHEMPFYPTRNKTMTSRTKNVSCAKEGEQHKSTSLAASKRPSKKKAEKQRRAVTMKPVPENPHQNCPPKPTDTNRVTDATIGLAAIARQQSNTQGSSLDGIYRRYLNSQWEFDSSSEEDEDSAISRLACSMNEVKVSSTGAGDGGRECVDLTIRESIKTASGDRDLSVDSSDTSDTDFTVPSLAADANDGDDDDDDDDGGQHGCNCLCGHPCRCVVGAAGTETCLSTSRLSSESHPEGSGDATTSTAAITRRRAIYVKSDDDGSSDDNDDGDAGCEMAAVRSSLCSRRATATHLPDARKRLATTAVPSTADRAVFVDLCSP